MWILIGIGVVILLVGVISACMLSSQISQNEEEFDDFSL